MLQDINTRKRSARTSPDQFPGRNHKSPGVTGAAMSLSVRALLRAPAALEDTARQILKLLSGGVSITLGLRDLGCGEQSVLALEFLCARLSDAGVPRDSRIGICLDAHTLPLRAFSLITRCWLGAGPRYLLLGDEQTRQSAPESWPCWEYLWRMRASRWAVLPAYGESVTTPCPLLCEEKANSVLPPGGIQVPAGSAWLPIHIDLPDFADSNGSLRCNALERALIASVSLGEHLLDSLPWPTAAMRQDAQNNRRIAITISGFGDLVSLQKNDPSDLGVLRASLDLAEHIRTIVWRHSAQIARTSALLPAIAKHEPALPLADEAMSRSWNRRWQASVERSAVRHRNLLVMSPYSVLPSNGKGRAAFADLLPVLGFADAHCFASPPALSGWNFSDFYGFHRRARAVMRSRNAVSLVATRA